LRGGVGSLGFLLSWWELGGRMGMLLRDGLGGDRLDIWAHVRS
jgi:hypothetical protein